MKEYVVPKRDFNINGIYFSKTTEIVIVYDFEKAKQFVTIQGSRIKNCMCLLGFQSDLTNEDSIIYTVSRNQFTGLYYIRSFFTTPIVIAEYYGYKMCDFTLDTPSPILADALEERANERLWPITREFTDLLEILRTDYSHLPINNPDFAL